MFAAKVCADLREICRGNVLLQESASWWLTTNLKIEGGKYSALAFIVCVPSFTVTVANGGGDLRITVPTWPDQAPRSWK